VTISADGTHMVYAVYASSANVWAVPIPNDTVVTDAAASQVTSGNQTVEGVRVSADRKWLVYDSDLSGNSDVYRIPLSGGEPERITSSQVDEFRGVLSPDGKELAYHTFETGARTLFVLPLDGGPPRRLTGSSREGLSMANWSPDGRALAAFNLRGSTVHVMRHDASGRWSEPRLVARDGWRPDWSPDGRSIVFVTATTGRIRIVPADSGAPRDVYVPGPDDPIAELGMFADNGREIYFKSHDRNTLGARFWSVPVTGGRPRLLERFDDPARASNRFDFASDGRRFYFTIEDRQSDIRIAELTDR
jgi:Tol biopolymer transport system component